MNARFGSDPLAVDLTDQVVPLFNVVDVLKGPSLESQMAASCERYRLERIAERARTDAADAVRGVLKD